MIRSFVMKNFLFITLFILCLNSMAAQNAFKFVRTDQSITYVEFEKKPVISFTDNNEIQVEGESISFIIPLDKFSGYSFCDTSLSSSPILEQDSNKTSILVKNNEITILDATEGSIVEIFSLSGQRIISQFIKDMDEKIDISNISPAVYILHINHQSIKFIKR